MLTKKTKKTLVGQTFASNKCGDVLVIEQLTSTKVRVKFLNTGAEKEVQVSNLKRGRVFDPSLPTNAGLGFADCPLNKTVERWSRAWHSMLARCNNKNNRSIYNGCTVDPAWLKSSNFRDWYLQQPGNDDPTLQLESDIVAFLTDTNKRYGPETSFLCSRSLNFKMGLYLSAIKELEDSNVEIPSSIFLNTAGRYELKLKNSHVATYPNLADAKEASLYFRTKYILEDILSDTTVPVTVKKLAEKRLQSLE